MKSKNLTTVALCKHSHYFICIPFQSLSMDKVGFLSWSCFPLSSSCVYFYFFPYLIVTVFADYYINFMTVITLHKIF